MTALTSPCGSHLRNGRLTPSAAIKPLSVKRAEEAVGARCVAAAPNEAAISSAAGMPTSGSSSNAASTARRTGGLTADAARRSLERLGIIGSIRGNGYHCGGGAVNRRTGISGRDSMAFETIETEDAIAACNGGGGPMGHPRVYLNLTPNGRVEGPYCSPLFGNPKLAGRVFPAIGVATPSAHEAGVDRPAESTVPRQAVTP